MAGYNSPYTGYGYQNLYQPISYYPSYSYQTQMVPPTAPMQTVAQTTVPAATPSQPASPSSINWVSGEKEASMWPVAPNGAVALWDQTSPIIYLKQADASGKPTMKIFDLVERIEQTQTETSGQNIDLSRFAEKNDLATVASAVSMIQKDIDAIKEEMGNLASQAVKRAVGAKPKKETAQEDDD